MSRVHVTVSRRIFHKVTCGRLTVPRSLSVRCPLLLWTFQYIPTPEIQTTTINNWVYKGSEDVVKVEVRAMAWRSSAVAPRIQAHPVSVMNDKTAFLAQMTSFLPVKPCLPSKQCARYTSVAYPCTRPVVALSHFVIGVGCRGSWVGSWWGGKNSGRREIGGRGRWSSAGQRHR